MTYPLKVGLSGYFQVTISYGNVVTTSQLIFNGRTYGCKIDSNGEPVMYDILEEKYTEKNAKTVYDL